MLNKEISSRRKHISKSDVKCFFLFTKENENWPGLTITTHSFTKKNFNV